MKRTLVLVWFAVFFFAVTAYSQHSSPITVMSYNIRLDVASDGENAWDKRKEKLAGLIRFHAPAIVGLQEAQRHQLDFLTQALPEYAWLGVGRDDGKDAGEFMAILYRKDVIMPMESSTFWCSPNPSQPGIGWDAACNRVVTWGKFRQISNRAVFYLFNTHLDHVGIAARKESARLLMDSVNAITAALPVVITGDFNSAPADDPYQTIINPHSKKRFYDTSVLTQQPHYGPKGTFNGFAFAGYSNEPIDYIFVSDGAAVLTHGTLTDSHLGRYPSDHFPLISTIQLNAKP
jgi:endonuclease/exonuclease/phosphatase family metal-dependent hydrolase